MGLIQAMQKQDNVTTTTNGALALKSTLNNTVDFFAQVGASRGKNIIPLFVKALAEGEDKAIRVALWARDVRGGAGERKLFRDILQYLGRNKHELAIKLIPKAVEVGRWDDVLVLAGTAAQKEAFDAIGVALLAGDGLCAKWMPRKGDTAVALRKHLGWTPKFYRKTLVTHTNVVETAMCSNEWTAIDYSKLPSLASARYQKAFGKHDQVGYATYLQSLEKGETKINAGAVYPYDIVKSITYGNAAVANQQWEALPDYVEDGNFLCMVDVSGSMLCPAGKNPTINCMDVAISLGLYLSERAKGAFQDSFLTFSEKPTLMTVKGTLQDRIAEMRRVGYLSMNTNVVKAFDMVLASAKAGNVPAEEMPKAIIILSDMQFDQCTGKFTFDAIRDQYEIAGYSLPRLVFWNLASYGNVPVEFNQQGVCLVSGFSPALMKSVLKGEVTSPEMMMDQVIMDERYNWQ